MHQLFEKNLITTKDAGELSGYTSDYLARLARSGKISGRRIGHSWLIDSESLKRFVAEQGDRKVDYTRALARAREEEYALHQNVRKETSPLDRAAETLTNPVPMPQFGVAKGLFRTQAFALAIAFLVVVSGAVVARAAAVPQLAEKAADFAREVAFGFDATFGDIPSRIAARIDGAHDEMRARVASVATQSSLSSARLASPFLVAFDFSSARMAPFENTSQQFSTASFASRRESEASALAASARAPKLTVEALRESALAAYALLTQPSRAATELAGVYAAVGEKSYGAIVSALEAYRSLVELAGARSLAYAAGARDSFAAAPQFVAEMNLALGNAVIGTTHAFIRADVAIAYGAAVAAPESARVAVELIGGAGDVLARATSRVPALATAAFLRATAAPVALGPKLAQAIFDAEYAGATHFVAAAHAVSGQYLALVLGTGNIAYEGTATTIAFARATSSLIAAAPAALEDAYLGALGKSALALDTFARVPKVAAVLSAAQTATAPIIAAVLPPLSLGEEVAVATYETIRDFLSSAGRTLAALFTQPSPLALSDGPDRAATTTAPIVQNVIVNPTYTTTSNPTYTTIVRGVSEDFMNESLASLRNNLLSTVTGMIKPVSNQVATNSNTIQYVSMIQDLSNLIVRNGDFRGGTFSNGSSVSATSGNFTNLTGGTTSLGATTIAGSLTVGDTAANGTLSVSGNVSANYFTATSANATSTFAGSLAVDTNGFVYATSTKNVGIGVLSPAALLAIQNSTSTQPIFVASDAAGAEVYRITNAGFVGIGTSSPTYALSVEGSSSLGTQAIAGYFTATSSAATSTFAGGFTLGGTGFVYQQATKNIGIGTTTPDALLSLLQSANGIPLISAYRITDTAPTGDFINYKTNAGTTLFRVDNSGNLLAGGIVNSGSQTITSTSTPQFRVQYDSSNEWTSTVNSAGATTFAINGTTPSLAFTPQSNALNTFNFTNAASASILSIDTLNRRVGIGTTSPNNKLDIYDTSKAAIGFSGANDATYKWTIGEDVADAGKFKISSSTALGTNDRLVIDGSGNVGIGTTAPGYRLSVEGSSSLGNQAIAGYFTATTSTASQFPYASTTQLSAFGSLVVGGTSTTTIAGDGNASTIYSPVTIKGTSSQASSLVLQRGLNNTDNTITFNDQVGSSLLRIYTDANTGYARIVGDQSYLALGTNAGGTMLSLDTTGHVNTTAHILPTANQLYDLGSPALYWRNAYANNIVANNLSSASTSIAGTNNTSFSINSNNPTTDTQDMSLIFYRGAGAASNAVFSWNSTLKRFEFNQNAYIANATASIASTTLRVAAVSGQTAALTSWLDSSGNVLSTVTAAGLLGVGTSSPSQALSVQGNGLFSGNITAANITATGTLAITGATTFPLAKGNFLVGNDAGISQATSSIFISSTGNVGIGTTNPGQKLSIFGPTNGAENYMVLGDVTNERLKIGYAATSGVTDNILAAQVLIDNNGNLVLSSRTNNASGIQFYTNAGTDGVERMRIDTAGNVGIGTTSPSAKLSIKGGGTTTGRAFAISDSADAEKFTVLDNGGITGADGTTVNTLAQRNGTNAQTLRVYKTYTDASNYERLRIDGEVIVTEQAGTGTARDLYVGTSGSAILYLTTGNSGRWGVTAAGDFFSNADNTYDIGWSSTRRARNIYAGSSIQASSTLQATGNIIGYASVGIGTTSPWGQLSVNPNGITGPSFVIGSSTATNFIVTNGGNVGISTTSPIAKFAVQGLSGETLDLLNIQTNSSGRMIYSATGGLTIGTAAANSALEVGRTGDTRITVGDGTQRWSMAAGFGTAGNFSLIEEDVAARLVVQRTTGNVGIGTTTPGSLLSVQGVANFTTATSTFQSTGGINLTAGCFAVGGTCVSGSGGSGGVTLTAIRTYTSGSSTYTPPANVSYIEVELVGAGGGGGGSGTSGGSSGGTGGATCFGTNATACTSPTLSGSGGSGGGQSATQGGDGGTASGGDINITGGKASYGGAAGGGSVQNAGFGANSVFGGGGPAGWFGAPGSAANASGSGGGGGGHSASASGASGGGAGGYSKKMLTAPSGTYYYTVGAAGTAGSAGTSGYAGGAGGSGIIIIHEYTSGAFAAGSLTSGTAGQLPFYAASGSNLTATSSIFLATSGNVGIGTTDPGTKRLLVSTSDAGSGAVWTVNTGTSGTNYGVGGQAYGVNSGGSNIGGYFYVSGGGTNKAIVIDTLAAGADNYALYSSALAKTYFAGNVGIGTTSPASLFSVAGNGYFTGNLGIGMVPTNKLDILQTQNAASIMQLTNANTGTSARSDIRLNNGTSLALLVHFGSSYTPSGILRADGTLIQSNGAGGLTLNTGGAQPIYFGIGDGEKMRLDTSGNLGIGDTTPDYKLDVWGTICQDTDSNDVCDGTVTSDSRLKTNVSTITGPDALQKLSQLRGVEFDWNETNPVTEHLGRGTRQIGTIAQEVESVFPSLIYQDMNGYKMVDYQKLTGPLISAVNELNQRTSWMQNAATSTVLTVDVAGNVGVGTTTPNYKLTVAGDIAATAFVNTSTREAKTDIAYTSASSTETMLDQLVNLKVATYRYKIEDQSDPLRIGFIAEDVQTIAPEILAPNGKGVDIYKLATFTLSGVQALASKLDAEHMRVTSLETRVAALESGAISTSSGTPTISTTSLASAFESFGVLIQKGIAQFNTLVFRQLIASKDSDGTSSAGSVLILTGNTVAQVNNALVLPSTKVFVTFNSQIAGSWWVSDKTAGSFRVVLSAAQPSDVSFDYFLVQTEGQMATSTPNVSSGTVSQSSGPDTTAPIITLLGDNPVHVSIGGIFADPGITVADNVDSAVPYITFVNGIEQPVSAIDTGSQTTYIITYSATDAAGNFSTAMRSVIVGSPTAPPTTASSTPPSTDTTAPVVTLTGAAAMQITVGDAFIDPGATAADDTDGSLTASIVVTGTVDTATAGLYTLTYTATDAAGNAGSVSRVVTVAAPSTTTTASSTPTI